MRTPSAPLPARRAALCLLSTPLLLQSLAPSPLLAAPDPTSGITTRSGVKFIDFRKGQGATPRFGQLIRFHYVGYAIANTDQSGGGGLLGGLLDSSSGPLKVFDDSYERNTPYFTKHGNGYTCQGLEEALHTMRVGGRRRVILPPALSFTSDKGPLPPGPRQRETLFSAVEKQQPIIFDVELLSAVDDLLDRGDYDDLDFEEANRYARELARPRDADDMGDGPMGKGL